MKKVKQILEYRGIICDSEEEIFTLMWLWELKEKGFIESINRAESIKLSEPVLQQYEKVLKTKTKTLSKTILREHIYTPEFEVKWIKPLDFFYIKDGISLIESKPKFDQNNMTRLFKINQKWVYEKYQILVNLFIPETVFENTFTPKEYLKTKTGKNRKIKWEIKTIEQWLSTIN